MKLNIPRVVVAGLKGGSGKTTLSLGLLRVFRQDGRRIVPFKKGPDYIDPGWLARAAGTACYNLDAFLFSEKKVIESFVSHSMHADGALIEGNRGLFDGMDERGTFSTARLAKSISSPVIVTLDCTKASTTMAAIVNGVVEFDREVRIAGVVLNQIAGERHESVIRKALETHTDVKVIGVMRRRRSLMGERHLGLVPHQESDGVEELLGRIGEFVRDSVDMAEVYGVMHSAPVLDVSAAGPSGSAGAATVRIGVVRDRAFQFYYPENIAMLEEAGADIVEVNAFSDPSLPPIDALYIGGGFPETQAGALARNRSLMDDIRTRAEEGLPIYAECGGLMYLGESIESEGHEYRMAGVLPLRCVMRRKPLAHGYSIAEVDGENPYYPEGTVLRGHEFHYSEVVELGDEGIELVFRMKRGQGIREGRCGISYRNVFATYTHVHALGTPEWVEGMIRVARAFRQTKQEF